MSSYLRPDKSIVDSAIYNSASERKLREKKIIQEIKNPLETTQENNVLTVYHGKATDTLATMNSKYLKTDLITQTSTITQKGVKLEISEFDKFTKSLNINTHKLLNVAIAGLASNNNYNPNITRSSPPRCKVVIDFEKYASALGYDLTKKRTTTKEESEQERKRIKNTTDLARRAIKRDILTLLHSTLTWTEKVKGRAGDFAGINILGAGSISRGNIYIEFSESMANYLLQLPMTKYPEELLKIDARNPNPYTIGVKLWEHYNMDSNKGAGTDQCLKVETILNVTNLATYEELGEERRHWWERVKEPLERALQTLIEQNILDSWSYASANNKPVSKKQADKLSTSYQKFISLYVIYTPKNAPNQTQRIQRNMEKIRASKKE